MTQKEPAGRMVSPRLAGDFSVVIRVSGSGIRRDLEAGYIILRVGERIDRILWLRPGVLSSGNPIRGIERGSPGIGGIARTHRLSLAGLAGLPGVAGAGSQGACQRNRQEQENKHHDNAYFYKRARPEHSKLLSYL